MNSFTKVVSVILLLFLLSKTSYSQQSAIYQRAAELCEAAANKYYAKGCTASGDYCMKMAKWNRCMVNALAGKSNSCGIEPLPANAPKCDDATIGGTSNSSSSSSSDPIKEMQLKQQQLQQELSSAGNASISAYENAINSGKKSSGAMVDATLAGAQYISDPKASLAYTGVGLGVALISWISEKKEAQRAEMLKREEEERLRRLEELKAIKASLETSSTVLNFISSSTDYHYTNLRIEIKRGMVKSVSRKDLYDVSVQIHKVINTRDSIFIYESVKFKNLTTSTDSCVISKISIPLRFLKEAQVYNGDNTNAYDPKSSTNQIFRHKNLTNADIKEAFTIVPMFNEGNQIGSIHSNLIDVDIEMLGNFIKIQKKYISSKPITLNDADFDGVNGFAARSYSLVFDSNTWNVNNFVDYLNFIKN